MSHYNKSKHKKHFNRHNHPHPYSPNHWRGSRGGGGSAERSTHKPRGRGRGSYGYASRGRGFRGFSRGKRGGYGSRGRGHHHIHRARHSPSNQTRTHHHHHNHHQQQPPPPPVHSDDALKEASPFPIDEHFPFKDISRIKIDSPRYMDGASLWTRDNQRNPSSIIGEDDADYIRYGTGVLSGSCTPAKSKYVRYLLNNLGHMETATPVFGEQFIPPPMDTYTQIEPEYTRWLKELSLSDDYPRLAYRLRDENEKKGVVHMGQLKLFLAELRFLTEYSDQGKVVIYAGAAPGHHIKLLSSLFDELQFELYDPCKFDKDIADGIVDRVRCHREYFTNALAKELGEKYQKEGILFISDIRTADFRHMTDDKNEECILKDNKWQREWCQLMKPRRAMLKFRLPYPHIISGDSEYLDGEIWLQSFNRRSGTETRLVAYPGEDHTYTQMKTYSHQQYEEQCFFFNQKVRKCYVKNAYFDSSIGFENNFDCWSYGQLIEHYLMFVRKLDVDELEHEFLRKKVLKLVNEISVSLRLPVNWLLHKENVREHYVLGYDVMDHSHFHTENQKRIDLENSELPQDTQGDTTNNLKPIALPQKLRAKQPVKRARDRRGRKRSYREYAEEEQENEHMESSKKRREQQTPNDRIGFINKIASPFPNPQAWKDKLSALMNAERTDIQTLLKAVYEHKEQETCTDGDEAKTNEQGKKETDEEMERKEESNDVGAHSDDHFLTHLLFKYMEKKFAICKEDENENQENSSRDLNKLRVLIVVAPLYVVLCMDIPPGAGILNDSAVNHAFLWYGICDTQQISSILDAEHKELYLYGILSYTENENQTLFQLLQIVGINGEFVVLKEENDDSGVIANIKRIKEKIAAIADKHITFNVTDK